MKNSKPILVANWKDLPASREEARALLSGLAKKSALFKKTTLFVAPPYSYLESAAEKSSSYTRLAAQDIEILPTGRHTGSISTEILKNFGVRLVVIGHSERRRLGETDAEVREKVKIAMKAGIVPLICVGERERDPDGKHLEGLREQIKLSLGGIRKKDDVGKIVLAYEPVWAIGKRAQDAISPQDLAETILFIRKVLSDMFGRKIAEKVPILYGGSVEPANAQELFESTGISGFLVGHASLDINKFSKIAEALTL